jgi:hypothetical protein
MKLKTIKTTIILGEGQFADGDNTKIIEGLATNVDIQKNGQPDKHTAKVSIAGIKLEDMEQMTFLAFRPLQKRKNKILIEAGNQGEELSMVFKGDIVSSFPEFSNAPDVTFEIEAITAGWSYQIADSPTSVDGEAAAADLVQQFAKEAGFAFINNGITSLVRNTTYNGSPVQKAQQVAQEINAELLIDDDTFTLQPWGLPRGDAVLLNPSCGLIGYPSFTSEGVSARCFFDPKLQLGGQVKIESIVPKASGYWKITRLSHSLSAYVSGGGEWSSSFDAIWLKEEEGKEDPALE